MMSADVKANIKQQEIKDLVAVYLIQYKKRVIFVGIPSILILPVKNREVGA